MVSPTYEDFARDEFTYLVMAYNSGLRFNAMVSQAQRICECYFKHIINKSLINNNEVMVSHNLRTIYDFMTTKLSLPIQDVRAEVMTLNNFYTHTRYPGKDAFMAGEPDIKAAIDALSKIVKRLQEYL